MKLVLANNQTDRFTSFYSDLRQKSTEPFDYVGYESLIFTFNNDTEPRVSVFVGGHVNRPLTDYDGVYLNGYLDTYELAVTMAICCEALGIPFVNKELSNGPSLSKLTGYAKLAAGKVDIPQTVAGSKTALLQADAFIDALTFPLILKRADADRGIDNFKIHSREEMHQLLETHEPRSIWILQEYVENDGFYLVSYYSQEPVFCIFRSLEARPDGNEQKAHMFKPKGGANAHLIPLDTAPARLVEVSKRAMEVMNRQIGSVDCLYDSKTQQVHVLEVNYNPQLVTIETFKDVRIEAFLKGISEIA